MLHISLMVLNAYDWGLYHQTRTDNHNNWAFVMRCAIWYHLYNLNKVKNIHGGVLILVKVKLQAEACNFTKINTPPWVFFLFFKLYKWHQIAQCTTFVEAQTLTMNLKWKKSGISRFQISFELSQIIWQISNKFSIKSNNVADFKKV